MAGWALYDTSKARVLRRSISFYGRIVYRLCTYSFTIMCCKSWRRQYCTVSAWAAFDTTEAYILFDGCKWESSKGEGAIEYCEAGSAEASALSIALHAQLSDTHVIPAPLLTTHGVHHGISKGRARIPKL